MILHDSFFDQEFYSFFTVLKRPCPAAFIRVASPSLSFKIPSVIVLKNVVKFMNQGLKNENVRHYFNLMKRTAIAFGANPETVEKELEETLNFEIKLSNASLPKELRRNAFKLYNPMTLADLGHLIPWLDWTEYTNRILTKEIAQVSDNFLKP